MPIKRTKKKTIITKSRLHAKDTGSPNVQIALLTTKIDLVTKHLQEHKKDHSARKGLLGMVAQRRDLLNYLKREKPTTYQDVLEKHKLKK
jgi:small subunit ribosomal protein S15